MNFNLPICNSLSVNELNHAVSAYIECPLMAERTRTTLLIAPQRRHWYMLKIALLQSGR